MHFGKARGGHLGFCFWTKSLCLKKTFSHDMCEMCTDICEFYGSIFDLLL